MSMSLQFRHLTTNGTGTSSGVIATPPFRDSASVPALPATVWVAVAFLLLVCVCTVCSRLMRMVAACWCDNPPAAGGTSPYHRHSTLHQNGAAGMAGREEAGRAAAALADHHTRMRSVQRDIELGLPATLPLPDGEEFPGSLTPLHIRNAEQEKEIYQGCIRPPPNRTVYSCELIPRHAASVRSATHKSNCASRGARLMANCASRVTLGSTKPRASPSPPPDVASILRCERSLTVVVPRQSRPPPPPPPPPTDDLLPYTTAGTRLAGVQVVSCAGGPSTDRVATGDVPTVPTVPRRDSSVCTGAEVPTAGTGTGRTGEDVPDA